jgi:hypothetical protein
MRVLAIVRSYTLAFFDQYVRGMPPRSPTARRSGSASLWQFWLPPLALAPLLDRSSPDQVVESVKKCSPATRPN